jgi:hypothetical protein
MSGRSTFYWIRFKENYVMHTTFKSISLRTIQTSLPEIFINDYLSFIKSNLKYNVTHIQYRIPQTNICPNTSICLRLSDDFYHTNFYNSILINKPYRCNLDITNRYNQIQAYIMLDGHITERN